MTKKPTEFFHFKAKHFAIVFAIFVMAALFFAFDIRQLSTDALSWIESAGAWGVIAFVVLYVASAVLFLPGSILTLGAGAIFGVVLGFVYVSISSVLGATAAFLIGRYFARDWIHQKVVDNDKFEAIDKAVGEEGWKIVALARLSPAFPFNLLNYFFGLTKVKLWHYIFASWVGMIPGTVMYVYLGSVAGELATISREGGDRTIGEWVLYGVGLVATIAVTVYVTKLSKNALDNKVP